ncbi:hypothetical protein SAMN04488503_2990 [Humidesulfovibrio mexicanus]|uniref:Phage regulatory protein CII (CP76) n=1 Tax=Humidesulfovibrio mexicanus TaxID=147047 RepID=A0A239C9G3_9BACT|nr:hypothetical protein [Humidesulfovibrio mexicanus]SNS16003.1 hypothetical protein SAMN04488503_2990 [Humidesulfovibrio mexicanus]
MSDDIDLQDLSLLDALDLAVTRSGKSRVKIAEDMGWGWSNANRIFTSERYWWCFEDFPRLLAVLGNTILLDWARAHADAGGLRRVPKDLDCAALVLRMGVLFKELGDVARVGEQAIRNNKIDKGEARQLIRELMDVANETLGTINGLRSIAGIPTK